MEVNEALLFWKLTSRESEVWQLAAQGQNSNNIAARLFISVGTVRKHVTGINQKFGVQKLAEAVKAFQAKLKE